MARWMTFHLCVNRQVGSLWITLLRAKYTQWSKQSNRFLDVKLDIIKMVLTQLTNSWPSNAKMRKIRTPHKTAWAVSWQNQQNDRTGIRLNWSVFAVGSLGSWGPSVSSCGQWRQIRLGRCPGWSKWRSYCWFCHEAAEIWCGLIVH